MRDPTQPRAQRITDMFREAEEAAETVARQERSLEALKRLGSALRARSPSVIITCARGSSDHAATFAKYAIETRAGIPVASAAPSVSSVYAARLRAKGAVVLAISQSGKSPDLLATVESLKKAGAWVLTLVNETASPLADISDEVLDLAAGKERSVAATKSFIASLAAIARLVGEWTEDQELKGEIRRLPSLLSKAWKCDWSSLSNGLVRASDLYVLGRGIGFGIAQEAALKLKETSQIHAEAFSTAELHHGPMALVREGFPALLFSQSDQTGPMVEETASTLLSRGAALFVAGSRAPGATELPTVRSLPLLEPILQIQSFYRAADALAQRRGVDPDHPPHLAKVTETR